jgi:hypothetical protein
MFGKCYLAIGAQTVTQQTIISYRELINVVLSVRSLSFIGDYNTLLWAVSQKIEDRSFP